MASPRKPETAARPRWAARVGWDKALLFAAVAFVLSLIVWGHRAPFVRIGMQSGVLPDDLEYDALRQRIARENSLGYRRAMALLYAERAAEDVVAGSAPADAIALIDRAAEVDPDNAVYQILKIDATLRSFSQDAEALTQFAAIESDLAATAGRPIDFGMTTQRQLWESAVEQETGSQVQAVLTARRLVRPRHLARQRVRDERVLALADRLAREGHVTQAAVCCAAVASWASGAAERLSDIEEALFWAGAAAEAYGRLSLLQARAGHPAQAAGARAAEQRCRRFRDALVSRLRDEPDNVLERLAGGPATTPRAEPHQVMMGYLITSGITLTAALAALSAGLVALLGTAVCSARGSRGPAPIVALPHGLWSWIGYGALAAAPPLLVCAGVLAVPVDPAQLGARGWLMDLFAVTAVTTFAAAVISGRLAAANASPIRSGGTLWTAFATLLLLAAIAVLLMHWRPAGARPSWFERSWLPNASITRLAMLRALLTVAAAVAVGLWLGGPLWRRISGKKRPEDAGIRRYATFKTIAVVSILGWMCCAGLAAAPVRLYYHCDEAFCRLAAQDARDEVAARLGPHWRARLIEPQATLVEEQLRRLGEPADE